MLQSVLLRCLSWTFLLSSISSLLISPHGGYLAVDEGADFYLECLGTNPQWILAKRLTLDIARVSIQTLPSNGKSILAIQGMDISLIGPYLCQSNESVSTVILQLTRRNRVMSKQIRFMAVNTNQSVAEGADVRLNCYAQYYSEKAMDSPYVPKVLWFFERQQIFNQDEKYILGSDSLVIRNFTAIDQGVYYCRAFITLRTDFLSKTYPILVQLNEVKETVIRSSFPSDPLPCARCSTIECPTGQSWNEDYSQCTFPSDRSSRVEILPHVSHLSVELGLTYTIACRTENPAEQARWFYDNGTIIPLTRSPSTEQISSYRLIDEAMIYLRLAPVQPGRYICRVDRSSMMLENNSSNNEEGRSSITLTAQMIVETNGISFQSSNKAEYLVRRNATQFIACRAEYFDFQSMNNQSSSAVQSSIRHWKNSRSATGFSSLADGIFLTRVTDDDLGLYFCFGRIALNERWLTGIYPIMLIPTDDNEQQQQQSD